MISKIQELEKELSIAMAKAKTWEKAFFLLATKGKIDPAMEYPTEIQIENELEEAKKFIDDKVMPNAPKEGEVKTEGFWDALIIEGIKQATLTFASQSLEYLKDKGVEWAIDLSDLVILKLSDFLFDKYQASNDEKRKQIFKDKILEKFPESGLANKLKELEA